MITSSSNQQIKRIQQLQKTSRTRHKQRVFVVEGPRMVFEAPKGWIEKIYAAENFLAQHQEALAGYEYETVSDPVFKSISDTQTPQGILAVVKMPEYTLADLIRPRKMCTLEASHISPASTGTGQEPGNRVEVVREPGNRVGTVQEPGNRVGSIQEPGAPLLLVLDTVQDPGNLGTMLRTGEGAGISGVLMNRTTADIFSPKVIRSTMGSIYRVPFVITGDLPAELMQLKAQGITFYAAHLKGQSSYDAVDYSKGCGFMIGNEGNGLSDEIAQLADLYIRIPMAGQVESLNAAMAAGLLMYEAARGK